jgi:hypothetical protein
VASIILAAMGSPAAVALRQMADSALQSLCIVVYNVLQKGKNSNLSTANQFVLILLNQCQLQGQCRLCSKGGGPGPRSLKIEWRMSKTVTILLLFTGTCDLSQ